MEFIGADGCKRGWFAVALDSSNNWKVDLYTTIEDLWRASKSTSIMLIDIPIGLPDSGRRTCDREARKILGRRGASVFAVPCRQALQARTYRQASRINQRVTGAKLSVQTWNIAAKIGQVDTWLRGNQKAQPRVRESHPELCFWALAGGMAMTHSKKTAPGFKERYAVLAKNYRPTGAIVQQALAQFKRKDLMRDDILDALALAVSARISAGRPKTVPTSPTRDSQGLRMEIVYPPSSPQI